MVMAHRYPSNSKEKDSLDPCFLFINFSFINHAFCQEREDEDYRLWLKGEKSKIRDSNIKTDCDYLKKTWTDPNLDENEKFLRDFILNKVCNIL